MTISMTVCKEMMKIKMEIKMKKREDSRRKREEDDDDDNKDVVLNLFTI